MRINSVYSINIYCGSALNYTFCLLLNFSTEHTKTHMAMKVWRRESKLWPEICSQKNLSCCLLMESPVTLRLRQSARNSSSSNSLDFVSIPDIKLTYIDIYDEDEDDSPVWHSQTLGRSISIAFYGKFIWRIPLILNFTMKTEIYIYI